MSSSKYGEASNGEEEAAAAAAASTKKTRRRSSKGTGSSSSSGGSRKQQNNRSLRVDTKADAITKDDEGNTPQTEASTPATPPLVRDSSDLRSPGQRKTPKVAAVSASASSSTEEEDLVNVPIPDLITQTDQYGNATTPRSETAIKQARTIHPQGAKPHLHVDRNGRLTDQLELVDACTETFMDTMRIMCCCIMPDETPKANGQQRSLLKKNKKDKSSKASAIERPKLLPCLHPDDHGKKCLVLDLDETLVHSSFRAVPGADFVIPVQIEDVVHFVYVMKRPGVDEFLIEMAKHYEIVIYTASLNKYADPLLDLLDPQKTIRTRLFRESCVYYEGNYVKDLSLLDRDLSQAIIIDNSPSSYSFHPENAIDCSSFIDDPRDRELDQIAAFLTGIKDVKDVRGTCHKWRDWPDVNIDSQ